MEKNSIANVCNSPFTKRFSTIIFDLDNTLIATRKADSKTCNKLSSILQTKYDVPADAANEITSSFLYCFRRCPDNTDVPLDVWRQHLWSQALSNKYNYLTSEVYSKWLELRYKYLELKPETIALLQSLRHSYYLAIITNGPSNAQWEKINRLHLTKYFDCILVSGDLPWEKPDSQIFYAACNHLNVKPSECVMVGDKLETDIQGAIVARIGCTIWMPLNGDATNSTQIKSDLTVYDLRDLLHILPISELCPRPSNMCIGGSSTTSARMRRNSGGNKRSAQHLLAVRSLPDLENGNSNSSDGS